MDAPRYPAATAFEPPLTPAQPLTVDNYSLAELMQMPDAWAIVSTHLPFLPFMVQAPLLKPHLDNFTVRSIDIFVKAATPEILSAIDRDLSQLRGAPKVSA